MDESFELHRQRRGLFGSDVEAYDLGRPAYPDRVYDLLVEVCGLGPATKALEIGPGTGQATRRLLEIGASVTAVELDAGMARRLAEKYGNGDLTVEVGAFEDIPLRPESFDLAVAATSFHWIPTDVGLRRAGEILRPGGWLALWWTHFGDADRPDPFSDAITPVIEEVAPALFGPSPGACGTGAHPYALEAEDRIAEIDACGCFGPVRAETIAWTGRHSPAELRAMFASFSPWLALPPPERSLLLDTVQRLAAERFGGVVERPYLTPTYLAQRRR